MKNEEAESTEQLPEERLTAKKVNIHYCGDLLSISQGRSEVKLLTQDDMEVDSGITHTGFIYSAASFSALCAINKKNSIIISSDVKFLAPVEINQKVIFKAKAIQEDIRKCEVKVEGFILDIKIFDGIFYIAVFDKKIFRFKPKNDNKDM